jgi:hypothetical protein
MGKNLGDGKREREGPGRCTEKKQSRRREKNKGEREKEKLRGQNRRMGEGA